MTTPYVTHSDLRAFELRFEVLIRDMELRLVREIQTARNRAIGITIALLVPAYALLVVALIVLYTASRP